MSTGRVICSTYEIQGYAHLADFEWFSFVLVVSTSAALFALPRVEDTTRFGVSTSEYVVF